MSYSFLAGGPTKTDAILDAESKFDKVCADMPVHEKDKDAVLANMRAMVNLLPDAGEGEHVELALSGWIAMRTDIAGGPDRVSVVNISCVASISQVV